MIIWVVILVLSILEQVLKFYMDDHINIEIFIFIAPKILCTATFLEMITLIFLITVI